MKSISQQSIAASLKELNTPLTPTQKSRTWQHPLGYKYLVQWSNGVLLRFLMRLLMKSLPSNEYKQKIQSNDASRSVVRNLEEGYKRADTATYIEFISYSQGSLEEVKGDVRDLTEDGFLKSKPGSSLAHIGINLQAFHETLKPQGTIKDNKGILEDNTGNQKSPSSDPSPLPSFNIPLSSSKSSSNPLSSFNSSPLGKAHAKLPSSDFIYLSTLYPPLKRVQAKDLSYEIFMELINKTDYLLRILVQSLEKKLHQDRKGYHVNQLRINKRAK